MPTDDLRNEPRQGRSPASIDQLLDAAATVFEARGIAETTTSHIAEEAGVSVGRLYYWFTDKAAISEGLARRSEERLLAVLATTLVDESRLATPTLVETILHSLRVFFSAERSALALIAHRSAGGGVGQAGINFRQNMIEHIGLLIGGRVPEAGREELALVGLMLVDVVVGSMASALDESDPVARANIEHELAYLVSAYLYGRYPSVIDKVWDDPTHPIRPAHSAVSNADTKATISPVIPQSIPKSIPKSIST